MNQKQVVVYMEVLLHEKECIKTNSDMVANTGNVIDDTAGTVCAGGTGE